ncbi:hypothetical protein [Vulcanisaeta distributa]|uniref:Uncharacterized protein n=1 Tax=Vulcanisaeta distributa (strain DSM 14429 / JCM 11212 / NBRC 100878 / IC-017) TaxID=572478 RepID=E1QS79_VULDI|nr:hypothetical protein [Vulcanisaeta distributa]ADN49472.1 hypothetical protein Vdis_0057 [Vulcanisaeta distributa DSM 14429]
MVKKRVRGVIQEALDYQLNWPIKLRELSIRLQDRSYRTAQEAIKLYVNGLLSKDAVIEIIRLSGVSLSRYMNPRRYLVYDDNDEVIENVDDVIINEFDEVNDDVKEVEEEYVGQRIIRRLMGND